MVAPPSDRPAAARRARRHAAARCREDYAMRNPWICLSAAIIALSAPLPHGNQARAFEDRKSVSPSACIVYAPDTSAADLEFTPAGIYNPGTATEKVICAMPRDQDIPYEAGDVSIGVFYRVLGATPARVTCTLFIGSPSMQSAAVTTITASGPLLSAGARGALNLYGGVQTQYISVPNTLVCTVPPKVSIGGLYLGESETTHEEPPLG
jgi:hypothetical protein